MKLPSTLITFFSFKNKLFLSIAIAYRLCDTEKCSSLLVQYHIP